MTHLARYLPITSWLLRYRGSFLGQDLGAGLTTACMLIPQSMAYAMLAGLAPVTGLYAATLPLFGYVVFGTSRELAVGPTAVLALLVAHGVAPFANGDATQYLACAVLLAFLVGLVQLVMGLARAGFLTNFLAHPVTSGFASAAGVIIGVSQLPQLLGLAVPADAGPIGTLRLVVDHAGDVRPATAALGLGAVLALVLAARYLPRWPSALAVVVIGTILCWACRLDQHGVVVVGPVSEGLPRLTVPELGLARVRALLSTALTIAFVGYVIAIAIGKSLAERSRYDIDPNQELVALGAANLAASLVGAFPVGAGPSRSVVNTRAGARTQLASLVTATVVVLALLLFMPVLRFLPLAVLSAIVLTAALSLIEVREARRLWRIQKSDLALLMLTFGATLAVGMEEGVLAGVGASLTWFVIRSTHPHFAVLGRVPGTRVYRDVAHFPEAETSPHILVLRMDAQFYFGNMTFLRDTLRRLEHDMQEPLRAVIIDGSSINHLDSSADRALVEVCSDYASRGIYLYFAGAKAPVTGLMRRSGFLERLGRERFCLDVADAVSHASAVVSGAASAEPPHCSDRE